MDNFVTWLKDLVYSGSITSSNIGNIIFTVFGCVLVCMVVGFIFKFILKIME